MDVSAPKGRRFQVGWKQLQDYGYSAGCSRCSLHRHGLHQRAKQQRHSEACRSRIHQAMRDALGELAPDERRRLEIKTKPTDEPKDEPIDPPEPRRTEPGTPKMDQPNDNSAHDIDDEHMDANDLEDTPDLGDDGMIEDTTDSHVEVDNDSVGADDFAMTAMLSVLQTLGVDVNVANRFCVDVIHAARKPTFIEAYGTGNIVELAHGKLRNLNVEGLDAFDLKTKKKHGDMWDFCKADDRKEAIEYVGRVKPTWIIGSPPCTSFSRLQGLNFPKMPKERVAKILREGRRHLHFVISLYNIQLEGGRHFLHEHPNGAASWRDSQMIKLLKQKRVQSTVSDQCQYGLLTPGPDGTPTPAKKPTRWASSSTSMLARLSSRCKGGHEHQHLIGGRAANAAFYPPELITDILRGMRDTADAEYVEQEQCHDMDVAMLRAASLHDLPAFSIIAAYRESDLSHEHAQKTITFKHLNGRSVKVSLDKNMKDIYKD